MESINFAQSKPFTLGVEIEFQILDQNSLDLTPRAPAVIEGVAREYKDKVTPEFLQSIVEVRTGICATVDEVAEDLRATIRAVELSAAGEDCMLFSASLHAFAKPHEQVLSYGDRYQRIMKELQFVGRQFICQGLHVHIGMEDRQTAISICDIMQIYLPLLLSLSSSSPFFQGEDTGFNSYRTKLFEALPLAGLTCFHGTWSEFESQVALLKEYGIITEFRDLWWDIRPSPGFGTVEVRICDLPLTFEHTLALVSLIQALAATLAEGDVEAASVGLPMLSWNKWQAARHGLDGGFTDPLGFFSRRTLSTREALTELLEKISSNMIRFQSVKRSDSVEDIMVNGTSAEKQRTMIRKGYSYKEMIGMLQQEYWR